MDTPKKFDCRDFLAHCREVFKLQGAKGDADLAVVKPVYASVWILLHVSR